MSDTGDRNPSPEVQEDLLAEADAREAEDMVIRDSGPHGDDEAGAVGAAGGLGEEPSAVGSLERRISDEDSDIGPADEGEEIGEQGPEVAVDAFQFPMAGFRIMFLDMVRSMLHRLYHNDHIIMPPHGGLRIVQPQSQMPDRVGHIRMLSVPRRSREGAAAMVPEGSGEGAAAMMPMGSGEGAAAMMPVCSGEGAAAMVPEGSGEGAAAMVPMGSGEGAAAMVPVGSGEGAAAMVPEGSGEEGAAAMMPMCSGEGAAAMVPEDQPEDEMEEESAQKPEAPDEMAKYQYENSEEEAQDAETKEEKEELNRKQEGPGEDVDPAESGPRKSSLED